nr:reverse transcriptase domain-containing protein [Tanacetum cinerariifolium]
MVVIKNDRNELVPTRLVTGWRVCIDNRKLNEATRKDHFPLPFMDQMLERLTGNEYYCFLNGFSGYFQIPIDPKDQEKTTFTCLYGTFAYKRMPFGLCNAPGTFQRCMMAIFHDMIEQTMEKFQNPTLILRKKSVEIENLVYDNSFPRPPEELNAEIADTVIESIPLLPIPVQDGNSQQEEINIVTKTNDVLPPSIENFADDPEGDIRFLEELLIDDSILSHESSDSNFEDSPLIPRPLPEPPDDNFDSEPEVISAVMEDIDEPDEHFNPGGKIFVSTNIEDVDYFPFMFVIRIFLPYLIFPEISPLLLSAESEDTIFDPGLSPEIEVILCRICVRFPRSSYPLIDFSLG